MKIAHLIDSGGLYGAEQVLLTLCKEQQQQGLHPIIVSCGLPGENEKPLENEARFQGIDLLVWRMRAGINLKSTRELLQVLKYQNVEILHSHGYKFNILLFLLGKKNLNIPKVTTLHGYTKSTLFSKGRIYRLLNQVAILKFDRVISVSPTIEVPRVFIKNKYSVIPNGIIECEDSKKDYSKRVCSKDYVIGSVGRLSKEKNFIFLINLMPQLLDRFPNTKLIIHGEGDLRRDLEKRISELNLANKILMPGYSNNIVKFMQEIDIYINCSTTEGLPITLLEAMRAGCIVLASDIPANSYVLKENFPNLIYDLTPRSFLGAFNKLKTDDLASLEVLSRELHRFYKEKYTAPRMALAYRKIYEDLRRNV
uniref:glycosyltransferase n=1 Tax=Cellvibrio fontiphilus TaxID=1815559 RepID=UPI002B4BF907|nr:glycosyltransferase [Cellvibrio fontiphilus]